MSTRDTRAVIFFLSEPKQLTGNFDCSHKICILVKCDKTDAYTVILGIQVSYESIKLSSANASIVILRKQSHNRRDKIPMIDSPL